MKAISYCHQHGICHRDLKLENFLLLDRSDKPHVKVIDFGFSAAFGVISGSGIRRELKTKVGTPFYVSPEVLEGRYNEACDVWSLGVILYMMVCGQPPFDGEDEKVIFKKVKSLAYSFEHKAFELVSPACIDMIRRCLQP